MLSVGPRLALEPGRRDVRRERNEATVPRSPNDTSSLTSCRLLIDRNDFVLDLDAGFSVMGLTFVSFFKESGGDFLESRFSQERVAHETVSVNG